MGYTALFERRRKKFTAPSIILIGGQGRVYLNNLIKITFLEQHPNAQWSIGLIQGQLKTYGYNFVIDLNFVLRLFVHIPSTPRGEGAKKEYFCEQLIKTKRGLALGSECVLMCQQITTQNITLQKNQTKSFISLIIGVNQGHNLKKILFSK